MPISKLESDKKFLFKSTLYNVLSTILKVIGPLLAILTARIFGKEEFGIFVSAQLWMLTLSRVAVLGLDKGLNWFLPQNMVRNRPLHLGYGESFRRSVLIATGITLLLLLYASFGLHKYAESLKTLSRIEIFLYAISLAPLVMMHIFGGAAEGVKKPQYKMFITDCAVSAIAPLISIALYFMSIPYALPLGLASSNILGCFIYLPLMKRILPLKLESKKIPRELLLYSLPRGFSEVISSVLMRTDLWMVLLLLGPAEAGVYAVMLTVSNGLRTVRQSFNPILLPVVAGMSEERLKTDLKPVYSYCVGMVTFIQLVIGVFIVVFPNEILMIAGKDFIVQPSALGILLFANLLGGFFGMAGATLNGMGKSFYTFKLDTASLAVAFLANYLLIPPFGLVGAALSTFIFTLFQAVWNNAYMLKLGLWPYSKKLFIQGFGAIALIFLYYLLFFME